MDIKLRLKKEILQILDQSDLGREKSHAENTLEWVLKLKPDASISLQIAALGHDIERGVEPRYKSEDFQNHSDYKHAHSERGASILGEILVRHKIDKNIIADVKELVLLHEIGGSNDADILRDADSISFFDNNLEFYLSYRGIKGAIKQVTYKYQRCSSRAREYIKTLDTYKQFKKKYLLTKKTASSDIVEYNESQSEENKKICELLFVLLNENLSKSESKVWHRAPVWFLNENPIVGYCVQKNGVQLLFWSGQSFGDADLKATGKFKAAELRITSSSQIEKSDIVRLLELAQKIQWDYKNIVKRKGELLRLA